MKKRYLRSIYYSLSPGLRSLVRRIYYLPCDLSGWLRGGRNDLVPPRGLNFTGEGDFLNQGRAQLEYLKKYAGLQPHYRVLDMGCGMGRTAVPLTGFLESPGSYEGMDVLKKGVQWCREKIGKRYGNFHFQHINLRNDLYKNTGGDPCSFVFPFEPGEFDLVMLFSVFTHMLPRETGHYLQEISRVLKQGKHCMASFFLYGEEDQPAESGDFIFPHEREGYRLMSRKTVSANVALSLPLLQTLAQNAGLEIERVIPGYWKEPGGKDDFQDLVVFRK